MSIRAVVSAGSRWTTRAGQQPIIKNASIGVQIPPAPRFEILPGIMEIPGIFPAVTNPATPLLQYVIPPRRQNEQ